MKTGKSGIDLIKEFEGLVREAYLDDASIWTIGYGHTASFKAGLMDADTRITEQEAEDLLRDDVGDAEDGLSAWQTKHFVHLNQNEFDALVSFIFNVGIGNFKVSTAAKRLIAGDRVGAAEALTWWDKATVNDVLTKLPGLERRRAAERALFLKKICETPNDPSHIHYVLQHNTRVCPAIECDVGE